MPRGVSLLDEARQQGRLFTPRTDLGQRFLLWLDATDPATLALDASSRVQAWVDKSGRGNGASQTTAGNRPLFNPTGGSAPGFPGLPGIYHDAGLPTFLTGNIALTGTICFVYVVCTMNSFTNSYGRLVSFGVNGSADYNNNSYFNIARNATDGTIRAERGGATSVYGVAFDSPLIMVACFDGTQQYTEGNGQDMGASAQSAALNTMNYKIGQHLGGSESWSGYINEVIVDAGPLSINRRQHIVGSLAQKWRFPTALYGTHPYRNAPPLIGV